MQASDIPVQIALPFAENAGASFVDVIPASTAVPGRASLNLGFPPLNFTPIASGGIPPFGQDMNGILNMISAWARWVGAGGPVYWDSAFSTAITGYPKGALVQKADDSGCFLCTADNNTTDPETGGANWTFLPFLEHTGVTAGSYAGANITVDAYGRLTFAEDGSGGLPPSGVTPGTYTDVTMTVNIEGIVTFAASGALANYGLGHFIAALPGGTESSPTVTYTAPYPVKVTFNITGGTADTGTEVTVNGVAIDQTNDDQDKNDVLFVNLDTGQSIVVVATMDAILSAAALRWGGSLIGVMPGGSGSPQTLSYTATKNVRLEISAGGGTLGSATVTTLNGTVLRNTGPRGLFAMSYVNLGVGDSVTIVTTQQVIVSEEQLSA